MKISLTIRQTLVIWTICFGIMVFSLYPDRPKGIIGWGALFLVSPFIVFGLEFVGNKIFQNESLDRLGSLLRMACGGILVVLLMLAIGMAGKFFAAYLIPW